MFFSLKCTQPHHMLVAFFELNLQYRCSLLFLILQVSHFSEYQSLLIYIHSPLILSDFSLF